MKNLLWNFLLVFCTICLFTACSDDENEETNCEASPVTGMIDGQTFNFGTGTAITDSSSGELFITLYDERENSSDPCNINDEFVNVFGLVPNEVGRTSLFQNLPEGEFRQLTFFNPNGFGNRLAIEGFIEITSIGDSTIEGVLDIDDGTLNPEDFLCGTFILDICE